MDVFGQIHSLIVIARLVCKLPICTAQVEIASHTFCISFCNQLVLQTSLQSHDGSVHTCCNLPMLGSPLLVLHLHITEYYPTFATNMPFRHLCMCVCVRLSQKCVLPSEIAKELVDTKVCDATSNLCSVDCTLVLQ